MKNERNSVRVCKKPTVTYSKHFSNAMERNDTEAGNDAMKISDDPSSFVNNFTNSRNKTNQDNDNSYGLPMAEEYFESEAPKKLLD